MTGRSPVSPASSYSSVGVVTSEMLAATVESKAIVWGGWVGAAEAIPASRSSRARLASSMGRLTRTRRAARRRVTTLPVLVMI